MKKMNVALACLLAAFALASCGVDTRMIQRMQTLEEGVGNPTTVEELTNAIRKYQARVEDVISAEARVGMWYKILGTRYLDKGMYGKALENFQAAIEYYPTNQNLYYWVGVCAGYMAKASLDFKATGSRAERDRYFALAESSYLRAIQIEPGYARPLYGLGILYVFELDQPAKAIPHLVKLLTIDKGNVEAMFVLARAYYATGDTDRAVSTYDRILSISKYDKQRSEAEANKAQVLSEAYGKN